MNPYPDEQLDPVADDGTMPGNVAALAEAVIGRRIVRTERRRRDASSWRRDEMLVITLDDGVEVRLADTEDCCAYTALDDFLLHPDKVDHIILGVGTTDGYTRWHIYADWGDVLELTVGWFCGNPFYYGYGFKIDVIPLGQV